MGFRRKAYTGVNMDITDESHLPEQMKNNGTLLARFCSVYVTFRHYKNGSRAPRSDCYDIADFDNAGTGRESERSCNAEHRRELKRCIYQSSCGERRPLNSLQHV